MYYLNITAYLFDNSTPASASLRPGYDCIIIPFKPQDIAVFQQDTVDSLLVVKVSKKQVEQPYFGVLYNGSSVSDMTPGFNFSVEFRRNSGFFSFPLVTGKRNFGIFRYISF